MPKRISQKADQLSPWLSDVQRVSVSVTEVQSEQTPPSTGIEINVEAAALAAATYRGDLVVAQEKVAKFSANGSLAGRFLYAGELSIDAAPTASDWVSHSSITLRGSAHTAMAFAQTGGAAFVRSGPRLLQIGYDTYSKDFPTSIEFPGGTRITEDGSLGIGVGVPATALHVSSKGDQVRVEYPGGGFLGIEVGPFGDAQFSTTGGQSTFAGILKTSTLNADSVNVRHLHNSTQVLDSTLALSGVVGFSAVSGYVMADVVGGAWTEGTVIFVTTYDRDVSFTVAERVAEPGAQMFQVGQTVTFAWLVREGGVETIETLSVVVTAYEGRDPTLYPAQQTYTFHQHEESVFGSPPPPDPITGGDVLVPERAIVSYGGVGALSMINGAPLLTMSGPTIGQWHADYRGIKSENGHMTMKMGWIGAEGDDIEFIRVVDNYGDVVNFELTSSVGLTKGAKLTLRGGPLPSPTTRLAFDGGADTLTINASTLQVGGTNVTLSNVVPNTAPAAGQILVGNAGGTAYAPVSMSGDATLSSTGALTVGTLPGVTINGHITIQGTSRRIIGDFGNATHASRTLFQAPGDTFTSVGALGGGATRSASFAVFYGADAANSPFGALSANSNSVTLNTSKTGTATAQSLILQTNSVAAITIDTSQQVGVGASPVANRQLYVSRAVTDPGATQYGLSVAMSKTSTVSDSSLVIGVSVAAGSYGAGTHGSSVFGGYVSTSHGAATVGPALYGWHVEAGVTASGGSVGQVIGLNVGAPGHASASISSRYGINVGSQDTPTPATTVYAINIAGMSAATGTNKYGLLVGTVSGATNNWAIRTSAGKVQFGDLTEVTGSAAASKQFVVKGAASQSANVMEVQDSAAAALLAITSAGYLGLGTASPAGIFEAHSTTIARIYRYANPGNLQLYRANGTQASPTQVLSGEAVGQLTFVGYGTGGWGGSAGAQIRATALENLASTAQGMSLEIRTAPIGSTTAATRATFDAAGLTMADAHDILFGATTGTKVGTATTQKLAFHGATPVAQRAGAAQTAVGTTAATQTTPWGFASQAQADGIITLLNELRAAMVEKGIIKGSA